MGDKDNYHSVSCRSHSFRSAIIRVVHLLSKYEASILDAWKSTSRKKAILLSIMLFILFLLCQFLSGEYFKPGKGFVREMWASDKPDGEPLYTCIDRNLDFRYRSLRNNLFTARNLYVRWTGWIPEPLKKQDANIIIEHDGQVVIKYWEPAVIFNKDSGDIVQTDSVRVHFEQRRPEKIVIEYRDTGGSCHLNVRCEESNSGKDLFRSIIFNRPTSYVIYLLNPFFNALSCFCLSVLFICFIFTIATVKWNRFENWLDTSFHRRWTLGIIVAFAIVLRFWLLYRAGFMTLADEAIVGVMGKHILEGKGLPCLFYGQFYGGPLESYLAVPLFAVFGISPALLKMVPLLLGTAIIFPVYAIARRLVSNTGAMLCAAYIAFPPLMCALYSLMAMIGPVEIPLLGMIYAALMLRRFSAADTVPTAETNSANRIPLFILKKRFDIRRLFLAPLRQDSPWDEYLMGLVAGLGFWVNAQILYFLIPCEILLLLRGRPLLLRFWWPCPGTIGLFIGMFPLLYYSYFTGWEPFKFLLEGGQRYSTPFAAFQNSLLGQCLPELLGGRPRWVTGHDIYFPFLARLVFWSFLTACLVVIIRPFFLHEKRWPAWFLSLIVLIIPIIFCASSFGERAFSRYLFAAFPLFPLIWITALSSLGKHLKIPVVIIGLSLIAVHARGLLGENPFLFFQHEENIGAGRLLPENNDRLISDLKQRGIDAINTDFWIGWNVAFSSGESIVQDDWLDRYPPYRDRFMSSATPAYVYHNNEQRGEWQIDGLDELFSLLDYECFDSPPYRVYVPKGPVIPRRQWTSFASENEGASGLAIDGDINLFSAWRSAGSQKKGAFLLVDTHEARASQRLVIHWGPSKADAPQGAQLLISADGETWGPPISLQPCQHLNGSYADLDGTMVRMFKIEITEEVPNRAWSVYDVFLN